MELEGFTCKREVKPLETWMQEKEDEFCHSCLTKPLASQYLGILEKGGASEQTTKLREAWGTADVLTIARTMDIIKTEVGDDLKKELVAIDCFAQSYKELSAAAQQQH
jgi:hypothetical protein